LDSIKYIREVFPIWQFVTGEHFLSNIQIHPKALELFDHSRNQYENDDNQRWKKCTVGSRIPKDRFSIEYLKQLIRQHTEQIKEKIVGYNSAHEYFVHQLANKILSCTKISQNNKIIFQTTDFKCHELEVLLGCDWFEDFARPSQAGFRGLGRYVHPIYQELFRWELEACDMIGRKPEVELCVVFPFVRIPDELKTALDIIKEMKIKLSAVGMMIEVGTNVLMVEEFIQVLKQFTDHYDCTPIFLFDLSDLTLAMGGIPKDHPLANKGIEVQDPLLKKKGYERILLFDETAPEVVESVKHVLFSAGKQNVNCGVHYKTLESINETNKDFSVSLINNIDFLVEDSLIV